MKEQSCASCKEACEKWLTFQYKYQNAFKNPVFKSFINDIERWELLREAVCFPTKENESNLNKEFQLHYGEIRFIKYLSKCIYWTALGHGKKEKQHRERNALYLLQKAGQEEDGELLLIDFVKDENAEDDQRVFDYSKNLDDAISSPSLIEGLSKLKKQEKLVLRDYYAYGYTDKEIAKRLSVSQQAISKKRNRILKKLKVSIKGGC
ncbi:helix-turn-helix transcriptional regulator [Bacillus sp. FJAT-44742]|uniref:helix-turn-helix transcriptional regulator n=1 Tax=Bacillus sp. FJAT-44742 TaxID=2014005 RepID=UPI000C24F661|nr:sigma-70 family RNA polymerase sigma factor [Bacillus sp. FJAT-44742]